MFQTFFKRTVIFFMAIAMFCSFSITSNGMIDIPQAMAGDHDTDKDDDDKDDDDKDDDDKDDDDKDDDDKDDDDKDDDDKDGD